MGGYTPGWRKVRWMLSISHNASDLTRSSASGEDLPIAPRSGFGCSSGRPLRTEGTSATGSRNLPHRGGVGGSFGQSLPFLTPQYRPQNPSAALRLETIPADCWDWITPDDVIRHALAAFYAAREEIKKSEGPWFDAEYRSPWADRASFRDTLTGLIAQRINVQAHERGVRSSPSGSMRDLPLPMLWDGQELSVMDLHAIACQEVHS